MVRISLANVTPAAYPSAEDDFSPDEGYPEYAYGALSERPNPVYEGVRNLLAEAGLDEGAFGTSSWNPLGDYIEPGNKVFVLCNFVYHRRHRESQDEFLAKCTHGSVIRAVIDYALRASGPEGRVQFGNAPLQAALWPNVLEQTEAARLPDFYRRSIGAIVEARDLRLYVAPRDALGKVQSQERRDESDGITIDLAGRSLFGEPGLENGSDFRVADYDPGRMGLFHGRGKHTYVIHRAIMEADVIVSVPKLKVHNKVGITTGLKGCVGAIGHKDCLPHYRRFSPQRGGDEYPGGGPVRTAMSKLHDVSNNTPVNLAGNALRMADRMLRRTATRLGWVQGGGWHGNDTAWRMTLDIARALRFGKMDGSLAGVPQRKHLVLTDGIIGGQGDGPLSPSPVYAGALTFAADVVAADFVNCLLMGFDPAKVPLIHRAFGLEDLPLTEALAEELQVRFRGEVADPHEMVRRLGLRFATPPGWRGAIERIGGVGGGIVGPGRRQ